MAESDSESTQSLVVRARAGDGEALNALLARYLPRMRRWAHGRLPPWARGVVETQDIVQDALVNVARHVEAFEPRHEGAFQAYVREAVLNRVRDQLRRAHGNITSTLNSGNPSHDPSPLEQAIGAQLLERYESALLRVKPADREAIIARIELGLPWSEVARALNKNSNESAQMAVKRALVRLAREMSDVVRA